MHTELMSQFVKNESVCRYLSHFAKKLSVVYPLGLGYSDAKNELWLAIFEAINKRWDTTKDVFLFAQREIFSKYGNMINSKNRKQHMYEKSILISETSEWNELAESGIIKKNINRSYDSIHYDFEISLIEAKMELDNIEKALNKRVEERHCIQLIPLIFKRLRLGMDSNEISIELKIPIWKYYRFLNQGKKIIMKNCSR
jgi:hypothetical protein